MQRGIPMMCTMSALSILLGIVFGGFQYSVLKMATEFEISKTLMGTMVSIFFAALTIAPLLTGGIADRRGKKRVILLALTLLTAGSILCLICDRVGLLFLGVLVMGLGTGTLESTYTAALSDYDPPKAGRNVNVIQGVLSLGCCVTPLMIELITAHWGLGWRTLYGLCLICVMVSAAMVIGTRFAEQIAMDPAISRDKVKQKRNVHGAAGYGMIFRQRAIALLILCIFIYIFMENGVAYFADTFISVDLGRGDRSAAALALFWLAMAISRFGSGMLYRHEDRIIVSGFLLSAVCLVLLFLVRTVSIVLLLFFILGLCFAPIWPFVVGKLNRSFPEHTGKMSAVILSAGGAGGMLSPYLMGLFADAWSVSGGFLMICGMTLLGLVMYIAYYRRSQAR